MPPLPPVGGGGQAIWESVYDFYIMQSIWELPASHTSRQPLRKVFLLVVVGGWVVGEGGRVEALKP